jgi:hypothetical protein
LPAQCHPDHQSLLAWLRVPGASHSLRRTASFLIPSFILGQALESIPMHTLSILFQHVGYHGQTNVGAWPHALA